MRHTCCVLATDIQWGTMAGGLAAAGTIGAVGIALIQVARERRARIRREQQVQSDRRRAHATRISAWLGEAERVPDREHINVGDDHTADRAFNWRTPIYVHNSSAEPVYEVVAGIVFIQGTAPRTLERLLDLQHRSWQSAREHKETGEDVEQAFRTYSRRPATTTGIIPPGTWRVWVRGRGWTSILSGRGGVDVAFVDRNGTSWVRRAMGALDELTERPLAHFQPHGFHGLHDLVPAERVG